MRRLIIKNHIFVFKNQLVGIRKVGHEWTLSWAIIRLKIENPNIDDENIVFEDNVGFDDSTADNELNVQ